VRLAPFVIRGPESVKKYLDVRLKHIASFGRHCSRINEWTSGGNLIKGSNVIMRAKSEIEWKLLEKNEFQLRTDTVSHGTFDAEI